MLYLIKSEWLRFRALAWVLAGVHLLVLRLAGGQSLFVVSMPKLLVGGLLAALGGLAFGLYQMGSRRKLNPWTYVIHRPLPPRVICTALTGAGALVLTVIYALPLLLVTLYLDHGTPALVDGRQYLLPFTVLGVALGFYGVGCYMALSHSRLAFLVVWLPLLAFTRQADGLTLLVVQVVVLAWLAWLVGTAFRPDRSRPPQRPLALLAVVVPIQLALLGILTFVSMTAIHTAATVARLGWRGPALQNWAEHFEDGTFEAASYRGGAAAIRHGLGVTDTPQVRHLDAQLALATVHDVDRPGLAWPRRHQLATLDRTIVLDDDERGERWTFSHDRMQFHGADARSGRSVGWLGRGGRVDPDGDATDPAQRFEAVPRIVGNRFLLTPKRLYEYDARGARVVLRHVLDDGEVWTTAPQVTSDLAFALTNQAIHVFEVRDFETRDTLRVVASAPVPGAIDDLFSVQVAELLDTYVVSYVFGVRSEQGYGPAEQVVAEVAIDGTGHEIVARRALAQGWSDGYRYRAFLLGPVPQAVDALIRGAIEPGGRGLFPGAVRVDAATFARRSLPLGVSGLAVVLSVASALLTLWSARRRRLAAPAGRAWVVVALLCGVVGYLSFLLLTPRPTMPRHAMRRPVGLQAQPGTA